MPDKIKAYLDDNDEADAYLDEQLDDLEQLRLETIDAMLWGLDERDEELWEELDVDVQLTLKDYEPEEPDDRGLAWILGVAGIASAASLQFYLDERDATIIRPLAYREQIMSRHDLTFTELVTAGKRGIEVETEFHFAILQQKYIAELNYLADMSNVELYRELSELGVLQPADQLLANSTAYVNRMTPYKPGSPQFTEAVNDLIDGNSKRAVKSQSRRAIERIHSFNEAEGELDTVMVWIGENDKRACAWCRELFGKIDRYGSWIDRGLPGADVCRGADLCRCHLVAAL